MWFIFSFLIISLKTFSQEQSQLPKKQQKWDTTYYSKYKDRFIVSLYQSYRYYGIDISQKLFRDTLGQSKIEYLAEANFVSGIEISYDKINFSVAYKSAPPANQLQKGDTKYKNFALNIGGGKWILENSYRTYTGFFNKNTVTYDTTFKTTGIYTQSPTLSSETFKTKFLYYTNSNKFACKSGYSCTQRQLKSAFSFVLTANINYNRLNSDSSFIPLPVRKYYDHYQSIKGLNVFAFSIYGGGSVNIVLWRALFLNLTLLLGPEEQWRTYHYAEPKMSKTLFYTAYSGDFRAALGLNFKRFFVIISSSTDFSLYNSNAVDYTAKYIAGNFSLGYRFKVKTPRLYRKFKESKWYDKL